jgi:hypothetical protein
MSVLPQITYGNTALIFVHYFLGYHKNEIHICRLLGYIECFQMLPHLVLQIDPYLLQNLERMSTFMFSARLGILFVKIDIDH